MNMRKLKLGIPKGSLENSTIALFGKAGFNISAKSRSYSPDCDDDEIEVLLIRPQEMAKYITDGIVDCGLAGFDWILESGLKVKEICELNYSKSSFGPAKWVIAVRNDSKIKKVSQLAGKRISTELMNVLKKWLVKKGVRAKIDFSWGATETKAGTLADAICELTETGESIRRNNLRVIDEVMVSTTRFISSPSAYSDSWKKSKMEDIALLLKGALKAEGLVGLKMNVSAGRVKKVEQILKKYSNPTISSLAFGGGMAMEVVLMEVTARNIIPLLKKSGAADIIEYPLTKVIR
ncbi:MAG: ATP phosphoribosyltransferase [Elusimicrobia bacterium HGW-Elusimicrobia-2]|nr:MAG: ATP phosphoribosyltransferase [Elusimicrobia bacterium HGW-Elusimicrobia-2]